MACQRDIIISLQKYIESLGITLNTGKNKAGGHKGFFKTNSRSYRIDTAKNLNEEETLKVLIHELIHYIHYTHDKTLKTLDFIFDDKYEEYEGDLLKLTVNSVPKDFAQKIYENKNAVKKEISNISAQIKQTCPGIKLASKNNAIEKEIRKSDLKYLLKYDKIKILCGFKTKVYSIENLSIDFPDTKQEYINYITLCSLKRKLNRINGKISRLNRYYTNPSELLARSFEYYFLNPEYMNQQTPFLFRYYKELIEKNPDSIISNINKILNPVSA